MKTFLSILTGIVLAFVILLGIGDYALHRILSSPTKGASQVASTSQAGGSSSPSTSNQSAGQGQSGNTSSSANGSSTSNGASSANNAAGQSNTAGSANQSDTSNTTSSTNNTQSNGAPTSPSQDSMASTINTLLQNPANPPVDCSALVQYVYQQAGITVPRTVAQQATVGSRITSKTNLQYGDIVFFDLSSQPNTPTFDGIYVGNGQFVARTTHGILSMGLDSSYWKDKFMFAQQVN